MLDVDLPAVVRLLWLAAALAACGDDDARGEPDAAPVDAAVDAVEIDAAPIDAAIDALDVDAPEPDAAQPIRLRIVAANLTSGTAQRYEGPGQRLLDGLDADVVLIQEWNVGTSTEVELRAFVDTVGGPGFVYTREPTSTIPNGVISRYPIIAAGVWADPQTATRGWAWARIDVPGPRDLWAVSVHLLTASPTVRNIEAAALVTAIQANVPTSDLLAIGGDFNTDVRAEPALTTLTSVVQTAAPYPADQNGNANTSGPRTRPYDWLLFDGDLAALQVPAVIGASTYPSGLVLDSRVYTPLTEVMPVLAADSGATNMQHMALARDVLIP